MLSSLRKAFTHRDDDSTVSQTDPKEIFDWNRLPVEMKTEILKCSDFLTRFRIRRLSKTDKVLVDSMTTTIPLVNLQYHSRTIHVTICEGPGKMLIFEMERRRKLWTRAYYAHRSDSLVPTDLNLPNILLKRVSSDTLSSLFDTLTNANVRINRINFDIGRSHKLIIKFLNDISLPRTDSHKTVFTCSFFSKFWIDRPDLVEKMPIQKFLVLDLAVSSTLPSDFYAFGGHTILYTPNCMMTAHSHSSRIQPGKENNVPTCLILRKSAFQRDLSELIRGVIRTFRLPNEFFCIPNLRPTDPKEHLSQFGGTVKITEDSFSQLIPVDESGSIFVKITECGTFLQKLKNGHRGKQDESECPLGWFCERCDVSTESWYFRETMKIPKTLST